MLLRPMSVVPGSVEHRTAQLAASGRISGRVVEGDHVPVRGVTVDARAVQPDFAGDVRVPRDSPSGDDSEDRPAGPKSIATDADGRFAFDGLAPGRWKLIVRTDRYDRPNTDPECELDAGRTVEVPDIHLDRGGLLSGYLRDEQGRPIAGRELFVVPKEQAARVTKFPVRRTRTDVEGRYAFPRLERGDWAVIDQEGGGTPLGQAFVGWHDRVQLDLTARG
jgi:Carboxypeptidase regulatory-like domain